MIRRETKTYKGLLLVSLTGLLLWYICACSNTSQNQKGKNVSAIGNEVSREVGAVAKASGGTKGTPIFILEEMHNSLQSQIQHAIILVRLYERHNLKNIALEGFLKEDPSITTEWWINASRTLSQNSKARVAVHLLKEGEISCAEFMKLVYEDLRLHPAETINDYPTVLERTFSMAPFAYLFKIAVHSLQQEHISTANMLVKDLNRLVRENNREAVEKKQKELFDYIFSKDSWVQARAQSLQDINTIRSSEQQVALVEEIVQRAKKLSVELTPEETRAMDQYLAFFRQRIKGTKTMAISAEQISDQPSVSVVAMVIGAGHTEEMCNIFGKDKRSYVVITPFALKNRERKGDIPWDIFERKYKKLSIYSQGFMESLLSALPLPGSMKPKPVLSTSWFQGKAELYLFTERIAGAILGPPNPPGGGKPPYDFSSDDFKGKWVFIDPRRISVVPDSRDSRNRTVFFPAVVNYNDNNKRTEIWVKAGLGTTRIDTQERESVESMLRRALEEVISEGAFKNRIEDKAGRVQITQNTIAAFAINQQAARRVALGAI